MPRPAELTTEQIQQWEEIRKTSYPDSFDGFGINVDSIRQMLGERAVNNPVMEYLDKLPKVDAKEIFYSGEWLSEQMKALGAPPEEIIALCQSAGQKQLYNTDPWIVAEESLNDYRKGAWDRPGSELAAKLMNKSFVELTGKSMPARKGEIIQMFYEMNMREIKDGGTEIVHPHAISVNDDGSKELIAMMLSPQEISQFVPNHIKKKQPAEFIFGMDRFCKEGQGTTYASCLSVHYYDGVRWKFGIIEYASFKDGRLNDVKPINWDNPYWNTSLTRETASWMGGQIRVSNRPGAPPIAKDPEPHHFDRVKELLDGEMKGEAVQYLMDEGFSKEQAARICTTVVLTGAVKS